MSSFHAVNESSYILYLGDQIDDQVSARVQAVVVEIRNRLGHALTDLVPSYTSVLLTFDPLTTDFTQVEAELNLIVNRLETLGAKSDQARLIEIPVYYGPEVALDLDEVSAFTGLSTKEVVELHSATLYRVYAIGFSPGFAYLGHTDGRLRVHRKATPRLKVPKGSLAIADNQTAIYPSTTPGGWQILGRTAHPLLDWNSEPITPFEVGDQVRFRAITLDEFLDTGGTLDEF